MRKIGADKIYTDSWLSINFLEKIKCHVFSKPSCNYFSKQRVTRGIVIFSSFILPAVHLHQPVIEKKKNFLKARYLSKLLCNF